MKVNTIEQYKILEFLKENFYIEELEIKLIDRFNIEVKDKNNDTINFAYFDGKIVY